MVSNRLPVASPGRWKQSSPLPFSSLKCVGKHCWGNISEVLNGDLWSGCETERWWRGGGCWLQGAGVPMVEEGRRGASQSLPFILPLTAFVVFHFDLGYVWCPALLLLLQFINS